jgi:hypothetical protein
LKQRESQDQRGFEQQSAVSQQQSRRREGTIATSLRRCPPDTIKAIIIIAIKGIIAVAGEG